ncbi:MAG: acyl transferase [Flavobacteriaceae bacterium]|nr:acyl transferase [Flavobacteriaceae bacterium]MDG2315230.1 acyl transferase [Flavobacteriaceae bacterium]
MHPTTIQTDTDFNTEALKVFGHQFENNPIYRSFCDLLYVHPSDVSCVTQIPFLPIQFFKSHRVLTGNPEISTVFTSSGTGGKPSQHFVSHLEDYERSFRTNFENNYGAVSDYVILGLLPSYLERSGSSLVYMVHDFIQQSSHSQSGFYLDNQQELFDLLTALEQRGQKTLLIGVSFALLDFVERFQMNLQHTIVMETGGMKGRRKELIRSELHSRLKKGFGTNHIHSEYGMTELFSQAYSQGEGLFECPKWMKVLVRNTENPLEVNQIGSGGLNIIDLANHNSCAFLATQDLGTVFESGVFTVNGRFDHSDVRGCNLMVN